MSDKIKIGLIELGEVRYNIYAEQEELKREQPAPQDKPFDGWADAYNITQRDNWIDNR